MGEKYPAKCGATMLCKPTDESEVARFEESLGKALPADYREFLLEWNGIHFLWGEMADWPAAFPVQPVSKHSVHVPKWATWLPDTRRSIDDGVGSISRLYGADCQEDSLWGSNEHYGFKLWTPDRFLSIGEPSAGIGRICLSLGGFDRGHVYEWVWPDDTPVPGVNCPTMHYMWWIAPTFREFWDILRPMTEEEWALWR